MSLTVDGFWKAGFWSPGFWAAGFWFEPAAVTVPDLTVVPMTFGGGGGGGVTDPSWLQRDDIAADIREALRKLEDTTIEAKAVAKTKAVPMQRFEPVQTQLDEAMAVAAQMIERVSSRIQQTQIKVAIARAKDAQAQLQAREEATRAIAKARKRRAAAFFAVVLGEDE